MPQNPDFEETSLFDLFSQEDIKDDKKELKKEHPSTDIEESSRKRIPEKNVKSSVPETANPQKAKGTIFPPQETVLDKEDSSRRSAPLWTEKFWEYDITKPSQWIRDDMKEQMVAEGFSKREANHIFKGLVFKEKIFNTKTQALEYLKTIPSTYAVKYKIGITPSPQMLSLERRLKEKEARLKEYRSDQAMRKFHAEFVSCPICRSKINSKYLDPPFCPVCRSDMRAESVIHTLDALEKAVADLRKRYEYTARKYNAKFTGGEKWIIRTVNDLSPATKE